MFLCCCTDTHAHHHRLYMCIYVHTNTGTVYKATKHDVDLCRDMEVDYKGDEVTVDNFMRLLTGRHGAADGGDEAWPLSRRLMSGNDSRVFLYMTGHGGDEFLKFHNHEEISSDDLVSISILLNPSCSHTYLSDIYTYITQTGQCLGGNARGRTLPGVVFRGGHLPGRHTFQAISDAGGPGNGQQWPRGEFLCASE